MTRRVPFTKNRETIYEFLSRAKRFHATSTSINEIDVTALCAHLDERRAAGNPATFLAHFVRATGLMMKRYPRLNHHLFHTPLGKREIDFEEIVCTLVLTRKHERELILLPVNIEAPHDRSVDDIDRFISHHRKAPLEELPQFRGFQQMKKMPRPALRLFSYLCRSNPTFYRKFFGTYGISPMLSEGDDGVFEGSRGVPTMAYANTCTAFIPATVADHARVVDGKIVARRIFTLMVAVDHYLADGADGYMAMRYLDKLMSDPARLALRS
jgi:hypothetical protein